MATDQTTFEIIREITLEATAQQAWDAATTGSGGWLWPMEFEPGTGGEAPFGGTNIVWNPPEDLVNRAEGPDGWFNQLEHHLRPQPDGTLAWRYVHQGVLPADAPRDTGTDGINQHTDFYLHTFAEYLTHFAPREVVYTSVDGPPESGRPGALDSVRRALALPDDASQGQVVEALLPALAPVPDDERTPRSSPVTIDYLQPNFIGLRTQQALIRFFGRNAFGGVVGVAVHFFGDKGDAASRNAGSPDTSSPDTVSLNAASLDAASLEAAWTRWLAEIDWDEAVS